MKPDFDTFFHDGIPFYWRDLEPFSAADLRDIHEARDIIENRIAPASTTDRTHGSIVVDYFRDYNLLGFPRPVFHRVYEHIRTLFRGASGQEGPWFVHCWLTCYTPGTFLDWHHHGHPPAHHGYLCIDAEPSQTIYRRDDGTEFASIDNRNARLIVSPSNHDHKTSLWSEDRLRLSLAFDLVPAHMLDTSRVNHIPI